MGVGYGGGLTDGACLTWFEPQTLRKPEHRLAALFGELIHQFKALWVGAVVFNFGFDEDGITGRIVPDMYAKGFYPNLVSLNQCHGAEDAEWLASLRKAILR